MIGCALALIALAGCKTPELSMDERISLPESGEMGMNDTTFVKPLSWDVFFQDTLLRGYVDVALRNNHSFQQSMERIVMSRAALRRAKGLLLPDVNLNIGASVNRFGEYTMDGVGNSETNVPSLPKDKHIPDPYRDFGLSLSFQWEADIWGKLTRKKQAAAARWMASVEATRFAQSMLISDLAIQYYELIGLDRRKEVLRNALASARRSHELTRQLKKEGAETQLAVDQFYARVLSIESKLLENDQLIGEKERAITQSPTRVKLFYDDKYIYIGVYCKDAVPDKMNRFIGNRDDNSLGDLISVAFDTYHDYRAAPEFNINLGGNKTDLIVTDKLDVNKSWNAVWEGRTHIDRADSSWTAELRIPFSQLRYNQQSEDGVWGLHVRRIIRRNNEVQNWSMIPLKNNGHVFSFGNMSGMDSVPKPRGIEFLPYVMGKYRQEPRIDGSPYQKGHSWGGNVGLDAKFALSDYTLDMTINPDYGQVELDPSVMNLTAYETFYDEKRPFFLEGKHILDFANGSDMMFYTRRIGASPSYTPRGIDNVGSYAETKENVPIIGALKLTGTNKRGLTIGVIESVTARSSSKVTRNGVEDVEVVEPLTNYTVARVQKNWKGNTLLGGMVTSVNRALDQPYLEDFMVRNAFTAGIDFTQYFKNRLYYIDVKGMLSSLHGSAGAITALQNSVAHYYQRASSADYLGVDPTRRSLTGTGGYVKVGRKGNAKWNFSETFTWSSPGFDLNDMGYMKETDYLMNETEIMYRQTDIWKIFRLKSVFRI